VADVYSPPLRVVGFVATRRGDQERGPEVRMRGDEAMIRELPDGGLVRLEGPRRQEFAILRIDDELPRGSVVLRDIVGVAPSEVVRVWKLEPPTERRPSGPIRK